MDSKRDVQTNGNPAGAGRAEYMRPVAGREGRQKFDRSKICRLKTDGLTPGQIAEKIGSSTDTVNKVLVEYGLNNSSPRYTAAEDNEIIDMYESGTPVSEIKELIGCSTSYCYNVLKNNSIERNHNKGDYRRTIAAKKNHKQKRVCLGCDKEFQSEGKWNRLCSNCRDIPTGMETLDIRL